MVEKMYKDSQEKYLKAKKALEFEPSEVPSRSDKDEEVSEEL